MAGQPLYAIQIIGGDAQTGTVALPLGASPQVLVTTVADGLAAPDAPVLWSAGQDSSIGGAPSVLATTGASGASTGLSSLPWTLGALSGTFTLRVQIVGQADQVVFNATGIPRAAATITALSAQSQSTGVSMAVADPPSVQVTDGGGNGIANYAIGWAVTGGGGGIVTTGATLTNAQGIATLVSWTLGAGVGVNLVTATATGLTGSPVTFSANGTATVPTTLAINGGDGQTGIVAGQTGTALSVLVTGAGATPIVGYTVTWTALTGGGSIPGASVTNGSGIATAIPTSGATSPRDNAGVNTYSAFVSGVGTVTFTLGAVAGAKTKLALQTQPSTNGNSGTLLPGQPVVLIQDANGNTVTSATDTITATVITGPGSVTAGATKAAVAGVATYIALTITDVTGQNNLLHFASGSLTAVDATNPTLIAPPVPNKILMVTQPSGGSAGQGLPAPVVRVTDASSVTIPGYTGAVTVALSANPGGSTLSGTLTVNCVNGVATFAGLSLNNAAAGYSYAFSATGLTGVTSNTFTITVAGAAHPNEPGGFTPITENDFNLTYQVGTGSQGLIGAGWYSTAGGVLMVTDQTDLTRLTLGSYRMRYLTTTIGGQAPCNYGRVFATGEKSLEFYIDFDWKVDPNWSGNTSGVNKMMFITAGGATAQPIVFSAQGAGLNPLQLQIRLQGCPGGVGGNNLAAGTRNINASPSDSIQRGVAFRVEAYFKMNTVDGSGNANADGIAQVWFNGTQTLNSTTLAYRGHTTVPGGVDGQCSPTALWDQIKINPTYGGGTPNPPYTQDFWAGYLYASRL